MADKRINALANTASSTASDDFIAVDGTTNGTRKLNAFSPTFGGNATVTGTLTVNGAGTSKVGGILRVGDVSTGLYLAEDTGGNAYVTTGVGTAATGFLVGTSSDIPIRFQINSSVVARFAPTTGNLLIGTETDISGSGGLKVAGTTASTTTSSGALVVGNGTSGGLGVGGSINAGGNVTISGSNGYAVIGGRQWSFRANSSGGSPASGCVIRDDSAAADRLTIDINGNTSVLATTASTSTSSGALVVSGGVGVAGSINTDGVLRFNANSSLPGTGSIGISGTYGLNFYASTGSSYDFTVFSAAGQSILLVPTGTRNVSFSGTLTTIGNITSGAAITTSAPVGGAGLWELGVYSSTAPSATGYVTIEIGGTVYKLLASNV